ncbi:hypothetical protein [Sinosporangium siamense]|uniref:hypothetical protein n=1 Tax=Sinosporangium siamense TaxID=1367973 RepID=UPI00194DEEA2|nr:hypothetical protein [Sinosporangium siamense]
MSVRGGEAFAVFGWGDAEAAGEGAAEGLVAARPLYCAAEVMLWPARRSLVLLVLFFQRRIVADLTAGALK